MMTTTNVSAVVTTTPHWELVNQVRRHVGPVTMTVPSSTTPWLASEKIDTTAVEMTTPNSAQGIIALIRSPTTINASVKIEMATDHPLTSFS